MSGGTNAAPRGWLVDATASHHQVAASPPVEVTEPTTVSGVLHGVVVVPAHPVADGQGGASIEFELVRTVASGPALVAFSNVAKLIERLGAHQPWLMIPGDALLGLASSRQVDAVVLDPGPGVVECVWSARSLHHLEEANNV